MQSMHPAVGNQDFVKHSLLNLVNRLNANDAELKRYLARTIASEDSVTIETARLRLVEHASKAADAARLEKSHHDIHYVSRIEIVGIYQSALAAVFADIPALQGYGGGNPIWLLSLIDGFFHGIGAFFEAIYADIHDNKLPLWQLVMSVMWELRHFDTRAPFPTGVPKPVELPNGTEFKIALVADWGGDNPAARNIANLIHINKPDYAVHLGDIYYGGTERECETFLKLWPLKEDPADPNSPVLPGRSFALNGNHEMYSGGQFYFQTVLTAFEQTQSFFCLQNDHWRIIGLDTAYGNFRLKPTDDNDPLKAQWDWLIGLLSDGSGRRNVLLTHHEPVSAFKSETQDGNNFRAEIVELLNARPNMIDSIFGWFFGHEHRCAIYHDGDFPRYNARLIGNGCIPHQVPNRANADPGCTSLVAVNRRPTKRGSQSAVSMFALLSIKDETLQVDYIDEDNMIWGTEVWYANRSRFEIKVFEQSDGWQVLPT